MELYVVTRWSKFYPSDSEIEVVGVFSNEILAGLAIDKSDKNLFVTYSYNVEKFELNKVNSEY